VVAVAISTRPDCIDNEKLIFLKEFSQKNNVQIIIELGLQSVKDETLKIINRRHTVSDFINACKTIKSFDFQIAVHLILNLPWDSDYDAIKAAKMLSDLQVNSVKLHSLYILKDTAIAKMYENSEFTLISKEEYFKRCALFLEHLSKDITIERFFARAKRGMTLFENWGHSWRFLQNELQTYLFQNNIVQGSKRI
jgi:radical SAM protein (TIGR01212 family)